MSEMIGHILYDDTCGFCRSRVPSMKPMLAKRDIGIAPLQAEWVKEKLAVPREDLMVDMHLLLSDGRVIRGADVYRFVMRRVWWLLPIYVLTVVPIGRQLFNFCYRKFADNRYKISKACRLPGVDEVSNNE